MAARLRTTALVALFLVACGPRTETDGGMDATAEVDGLTDAELDATTDAQLDATTDAQLDATTDAQLDATTDAQLDATTDGGVDAATDASPDACVPTPETCNGLDDDCNELVDDGDPGGGGPCTTGLLGVCSAGTSHCASGVLACVPDVLASSETCNGLDDDCNGFVDDGFDTSHDVSNCGACGNVCPTAPNASPTCSESVCGTTCNTGWGDCDGSATTGCETDTASDANHCGGCWMPCFGPPRKNLDVRGRGVRPGDGMPVWLVRLRWRSGERLRDDRRLPCSRANPLRHDRPVVRLGSRLATVNEPDVRAQSTAIPSVIDLLSTGYSTYIGYGTYPEFYGTAPSYAAQFRDPLSGMTTFAYMRTAYDDPTRATLLTFAVNLRMMMTQVVEFQCTQGTTTVLPAP